jgi:hypothetical protein
MNVVLLLCGYSVDLAANGLIPLDINGCLLT